MLRILCMFPCCQCQHELSPDEEIASTGALEQAKCVCISYDIVTHEQVQTRALNTVRGRAMGMHIFPVRGIPQRIEPSSAL